MIERHALFIGLAAATSTACDRSAGHGAAVNKARCDTLDYEARSLAARVQVPQGVGVELETSQQAIRDVDQRVERYFAEWRTVCLDYRNGTLTREEYRDESQRIRLAMERFEELALRLEKASTPEEFETTLKETWTAVLPENERVDIELEVSVMAKRPGETSFSVAPPGATLPSGSEIYGVIRLDGDANLQVYQIAAKGGRTPLFPDPQIQLANPVRAGKEIRLPPNGVYVLDDQDLGLEDLHIVATSEALAEGAATPPATTGAGAADCATRGLKFVADDCPRTRGLSFQADPAGVSLKAENAAAQSGVHVVYTFHHVGDPKTYGKKCPDDPKVNCRGLEAMRGAVDRRPPKMPGNFEACPGQAAPKEMAGPEGSYERWCVETNPQSHLVDHGPYRKWYASGQLWITGALDMGRRIGTWTTFDANGRKLAEVTY